MLCLVLITFPLFLCLVFLIKMSVNIIICDTCHPAVVYVKNIAIQTEEGQAVTQSEAKEAANTPAKEWKTVSTVLEKIKTFEALAEQNMFKTIKHEMKGNTADDTLVAFEKLWADCSVNLDQTADPFDVILKDVSQDCFDVTISSLTERLERLGI